MMYSDEEKEIPEGSFMRPGDEIISIREVCLDVKFDRKDFEFHNEALLSSSSRNDTLDLAFLRDGFYPDALGQQQARFAWTEEDGNIASLVSEPGFGTTGQTLFAKDIDKLLKREMKEAKTSSAPYHTNRNGMIFARKPCLESSAVSSTSTSNPGPVTNPAKSGQGACKVDKADPRSRFHYVKYLKRNGRTVKLWECGICSREFQHQYTLMRHLPTHTDERNFHCDTCGKSFRQLSTLSQHRAIHSADRPYSCEVCQKTFNRVSTLISHRKTHSDEKPYKCNMCPKGFHQKGNLRNHLFTHTNERPYRCNICLKGFNQQSNLVCHKNKSHPGDTSPILGSGEETHRITTPAPEREPNTKMPINNNEVSSSIGPYIPTASWTPKSPDWEVTPRDLLEGFSGSGVIVDRIKTYHMGVALATKQTPFALLTPDHGTPVLVKVVDTALPGEKQMLVPATAEDLRVGGKIVVNSDGKPRVQTSSPKQAELSGAVQIRVPVVATVVPKMRAGKLHLSVEEPHHAFHTALSADMGEVTVEPCLVKDHTEGRAAGCSYRLESLQKLGDVDVTLDDSVMKTSGRMSSTCALPPPAPSPPLDLTSLDLFEPMECIPLGPQITAVEVEHIDELPASDDSDIFISQFEDGIIVLSDSDCN